MKFKKTDSFYDYLLKISQLSKECFHNVDRCAVITHQARSCTLKGPFFCPPWLRNLAMKISIPLTK